MTEPTSDLKRDVLSFTGAFARRALDNLWTDGSSVYGLARETVARTAKGIAFGAAGAALGAVGGFLVGPARSRDGDPRILLRERVLSDLRFARTLRQMLPMGEQMLRSWEMQCARIVEDLTGEPAEDEYSDAEDASYAEPDDGCDDDDDDGEPVH